jgi:hypothetical protein
LSSKIIAPTAISCLQILSPRSPLSNLLVAKHQSFTILGAAAGLAIAAECTAALAPDLERPRASSESQKATDDVRSRKNWSEASKTAMKPDPIPWCERHDEKADNGDRLKAASIILDRGMGKPLQMEAAPARAAVLHSFDGGTGGARRAQGQRP